VPESDIAKQDSKAVVLAAETMYRVLCRRGFPLVASALQQAVTTWLDNPNRATDQTLRGAWQAARAAIRVSRIVT
jgi:uncharacterized iron-regulated protein